MAKLLSMQSTIPDCPEYSPAKKALQDVITRWWSTFRMLRRLRILRKAIEGLIATNQINKDNLTEQQWLILHEIEEALKPMARAQRFLEGDKYPTASFVPYFLYKIRKTYAKIIDDDATTESTRALAKILLKDFNERRYGDGTQVFFEEVKIGAYNRYVSLHPKIVLASALDPRTKGLSPFIPENDHDQIDDALLDLIVEIAVEKANSGPDDCINVDEQRSVKRARTDEDEDDDFFDEMDEEKDAEPNNNVIDQGQYRAVCRVELERYKRAPKLKHDGDPLQWWKLKEELYPNLAELAKRYLAIPASSAPSERLWSIASRIATMRRASLDSEVLGHLMFLRENVALLKDFIGDTRIIPGFIADEDEEEEAVDVGV